MQGLGQFAIEGHYHRGFLLPHRQNMLHLPAGPAHALEARIIIKSDGAKRWHQLYNNPEVGITVRGFDLANHDLLGYGLAVGGFFSAPIYRKKRFTWSLEIGTGLAYTSKKFDADDNYKNIAIGSDLNAYLFLGQKISYNINERIQLSAALNFNHISNAAYALPNLGLNYPMVSLGMQTVLSVQDSSNTLVNFGDENKIKGYWDVSSSFGVKEIYDPRNTKFATYNLGVQRAVGISKKSSIAPGIDVFYNSALKTVRANKGDTVNTLSTLQSGIRVGYQLHIDQFIVSVQLGVYLLDGYKEDGFIYHRAGMRYYLSDHWGINLSLKTHFFKADFFELGAAYRF